MVRQDATLVLQNSARGGQNYAASRQKLATQLVSNLSDPIRLDNAFLSRKLFELDKANWHVLGFDSKDWPILEKFSKIRSVTLDAQYELFVRDYILANKNRVERLYAASHAISAAVIRDDGDAITNQINLFDDVDRQSLFFFRVFAAQRSHSNELLVNYFKKHMSTDWLRKRFLYPFVYYAINNTSDLYLDNFLSYVLSGSIKFQSERDAIKYLLCDEIADEVPKCVKLYSALLCHPFDACEFLLNHYEIEFVKNGSLGVHSQSILDDLAELNVDRIRSLRKIFTKSPIPFKSEHTGDRLRQLFDLNKENEAALLAFASVNHDSAFPKDGLSRIPLELSKMRDTRYPSAEDFTSLTHNAFKWRFVDAGRLLNGLLTSIYMVTRREKDYEARMLLRLVSFFEEITPFLLAAPSGVWAMDRRILPSVVDLEYAEVEERCDSSFLPSTSYKSRLWIKAAHWDLRTAEREIRIKSWLEGIRRDIRVSPAYLTGIDWDWLEEVIQAVRLAPFRGMASGAYVLLLMQIENRHRDSTMLRSAIEPVSSSRTYQELIEWLIEEFEDEAVAFVRFLLTADNILLLQLAPNFTAALSMRISALEECVRRFGFGELLDESRYVQETRALTSTLLLLNVASGQFEIPWENFKSDMSEKERDSYEAYRSLTGAANSLPLLGNARVATPHRFRNGKIVDYEFENSLWPLVFHLLSIIDGFIEHPSFGMEVLLSTRFRHDTMVREYERVLNEAREASIAGVSFVVQYPIFDEISEKVHQAVERWLSSRMQSVRPGRPFALFDMTPSQDELRQIAISCQNLSSLDEIIQHVVDWLNARLFLQVASAREKFESELGVQIEKIVAMGRAEIEGRNIYRETDVARCASLIATVLKRITGDLSSWFQISDARDRPTMTFKEVKNAADGVFETQINKRTLSTTMMNGDPAETKIDPEKVRLCFDLISEAFANTLKHGKAPARVKIWWPKTAADNAVVFSTPTNSAEPKDYLMEGKRYLSVNDTIFREGNSGIAKISALAASLVERDVTVKVIQRRHMFHLVLPLWSRTNKGGADEKDQL